MMYEIEIVEGCFRVRFEILLGVLENRDEGGESILFCRLWQRIGKRDFFEKVVRDFFFVIEWRKRKVNGNNRWGKCIQWGFFDICLNRVKL